jgi:hypothetical protein
VHSFQLLSRLFLSLIQDGCHRLKITVSGFAEISRFSMLRFGSGTYNVRASEHRDPNAQQTRRPMNNTIVCTVSLLDDTEQHIELDVRVPSKK